MAPTLYMSSWSPPVRTTLITAKALGVELNLVEINLIQGEQKQPAFLNVNPQHTVPTLIDDDGFSVWDSHTIIAYLVGKYGQNDSLYPKDLKKRALIHQRLHFDNGVLFVKLVSMFRPIFFGNKTNITDADKESVEEGYAILETFLEGKQWLANESLSIADYSIVATISSLDIAIPINASKFSRLTSWFKKVQSLPEYTANLEGLERLRGMLKDIL